MTDSVPRIAALIVAVGIAAPALAQEPDSAKDSTIDIRRLFRAPRENVALTITSGKAYNRVEGLAIQAGPAMKGRIGRARLSVSALGILRSARGFHRDSENLGHRLTAEVRVGRRRGFAAGFESFDIVSPIERWQIGEPDAGLAAFVLRRDYLDYFGRHGGRIHVSASRGTQASIEAGFSDERWSSRRQRDAFSLFGGDESWRTNPRINDGRAHVADLSLNLDSRNSQLNPLTGWYLDAEYERGSGRFMPLFAGDQADIVSAPMRAAYGRLFVDLRRYNRMSPKRQLNSRLVLGGWLHGDPLPLQRRFSVGGIGTLPGFDFRRMDIGTDVGQCSDGLTLLPGRPAQCERVALAQLEYRHELLSELFDVFNRNGIRVRGAVFRVKPSVVVFADAGRGWLVGTREGKLRYPSGSFPSLDSFRTDIGAGLDLGIAGIYVAKATSSWKEPANFFVRIRNRF